MMILQWTEPFDTGKTPLTGYQIEARLGGLGSANPWQLWENAPGSATKTTLQMLTPGAEYQFRQGAVNKVGKSEPSQPSKPKIAKAKNCTFNYLLTVTLSLGRLQ